jgi:hypothetical protein
VSIATEAATVYRGGGRRWFTLKSACKAEARNRIKALCECDKGEIDYSPYGTPPYYCRYHQDERYPKILRRLTRLYIAAYRAGLVAAHTTGEKP